HPGTRVLPCAHAADCRGDDGISQVPAEPPCRYAHAPVTPEEPDGTRRCVPPARPRIRERPRLLRLDFRSSMTWLGDSLSTLRRGGRPTRRKTRLRLLAKLCRAGFTPAGFYREFQLCFSFTWL